MRVLCTVPNSKRALREPAFRSGYSRHLMATFDELYRTIEALPQGKTGQILDAGVLTVVSSPHPRHQRTLVALTHALGACDLDAGGRDWWFLPTVEVRFPDDRLVVPDLLGYRIERVAEIPDE